MKNNDLFLTDNSIAIDLINDYEYPYEVLPNIHDYILKLGDTLGPNYNKIADDIWISKSAMVSDTASITGPCIIDDNAEVRHNAFIRGDVIIGRNCVLGNSCEIKNAILFDEAEIPHFNYVGDSIIGFKAHLGAGAITSNLKNDKSNIVIDKIETNLRKVGAFLGDNVEVGCNSVLNPGTIIGTNTWIYPLSNVRGVIEPNMIVKQNERVEKEIL